MSKVVAPKGLDSAGSSLWRTVTGKYELRSDELVTLESACRATDRVVLMRSELAGMTMLVPGSMGQLTLNPLVAEIRAHEAQIARLLVSLKLPDDGEGSGAETRST